MSFNTQLVYPDANLGWLEHKWVVWYIWIGNPVVATGLMGLLLHEVCATRSFSSPLPTSSLSRLSTLVVVCLGSS